MMDETLARSQRAADDVTAQLRARAVLLWLVTGQESRADRYLFGAAAKAKMETRLWDIAAGVTGIDGKPIRVTPDVPRDPSDPDDVLRAIEAQEGTPDTPNRVVWVLHDMPAWLSGPGSQITLRRMRNLAKTLSGKPLHSAQAVIIVSPSSDVPAELSDLVTVIDWPLPDRTEIAEILDTVVATLPDTVRASAAPNGSRDAAIDAAVGLSESEAQATFARSLVQLRRIDPATIAAEKKRVVAREGVLEWVDTQAITERAVGYDVMRAWTVARAGAFSPAARAYGLPAPKGMLLVGIPGCGKSLTAKTIAAEWQVPLLRLDLGALKSKYVGESEGNLRKALRVIEAIGRCVVWLDEIEKALAGSTGEQGDGGVSSDALGAILSWMQDRQGEAFVIATANDASKLPPELLRKGRFDEIFWVDLPTYDERAAIIRAAVKSHGHASSNINPYAIAAATDTFTGAEIAALVPEALFTAFNDGVREITTDDLMTAAKDVVPLARTADTKLAQLRAFWAGRARNATSPQTADTSATATASAPALDI